MGIIAVGLLAFVIAYFSNKDLVSQTQCTPRKYVPVISPLTDFLFATGTSSGYPEPCAREFALNKLIIL